MLMLTTNLPVVAVVVSLIAITAAACGGSSSNQPNTANTSGQHGAACGGVAGLACPDKQQSCVDNPDDDCDPAKGGMDCGGICVTK